MNEFTKGEFMAGMGDTYAPGCDFIPIESSAGDVPAWAMADVDVGMTDEVRANAALIATALTSATRLAERGFDAQAVMGALPEIIEAVSDNGALKWCSEILSRIRLEASHD